MLLSVMRYFVSIDFKLEVLSQGYCLCLYASFQFVFGLFWGAGQSLSCFLRQDADAESIPLSRQPSLTPSMDAWLWYK